MTKPLNGWKQISDYLQVCVRTAKKMYKRDKTMPIAKRGGTYFANPIELLKWSSNRKDRENERTKV